MTDPIVSVDHLIHHYGTRLAVDDLTFTVQPGEVLALLVKGLSNNDIADRLKLSRAALRPDLAILTMAGSKRATISISPLWAAMTSWMSL